jgi:hypothetical protein
MQRYAGFADDETDPRKRPEHSTKDQVFERYNFKVAPDRNVYGAWSKSQINLTRIDPDSSPSADQISNVLVIFWATYGSGQRKVVGWYSDATVCSQAQENSQRDRDQNMYICKAPRSVLLSPKASPPPVPLALKEPGVNGVGNHFGHWYPFTDQGELKVTPWLSRLVVYIDSQPTLVAHTRPDLIDEDQLAEEAEIEFARDHGYSTNATLRKSLEEYALSRAIARFKSKGYKLLKRVGKPYDLLFSKEGKNIFVEVKGTQTDGSRIFLTPNEVACAYKEHPHYHLFIVHSILLSDGADPIPQAGSVLWKKEFQPDQRRLRALAYSYLL